MLQDTVGTNLVPLEQKFVCDWSVDMQRNSNNKCPNFTWIIKGPKL